MRPDAALRKVRAACLAIADVTERSSHGSPCWFVGGKQFAAFLNDHHGDGRLALWLCAEHEAQTAIVASDPEVYFVPPYVGPSGWIGVRLDRDLEWSQVAALLELAAARTHPIT